MAELEKIKLFGPLQPLAPVRRHLSQRQSRHLLCPTTARLYFHQIGRFDVGEVEGDVG